MQASRKLRLQILEDTDSADWRSNLTELDVGNMGASGACGLEPTVHHSQREMLLLAAELMPKSLTSPNWHQALLPIANRLPASGFLGFECRLAPGPSALDLHHPLYRPADYRALLDHRPRDANWPPLYVLVAGCLQEGDVLGRGIATLWIEADRPTRMGSAPVPAVFAGLKATVHTEQLLCLLIERCLPDTSPRRLDQWISVMRQVAALGGRISHFGFMLSRPKQPVRINVEGLEPGGLDAILGLIDWPAQRRPELWPLERLDASTEWTRLALDLGETLLPSIGLEILPKPGVDRSVWIRDWLPRLVTAGLCCPAKSAGVQAWPRRVRPSKRDDPWPDALLIEHLIRRPDDLSELILAVQHLKLSWRVHHCQAKVYLAMGRRWYDRGRA